MPDKGVYGPGNLRGEGADKFARAMLAVGGAYVGYIAYAYGLIRDLNWGGHHSFLELQDRGMSELGEDWMAMIQKWLPGDNETFHYDGWRDFRGVKERVDAICADLESVGL